MDINQHNTFGPNTVNMGHLGVEGYPGISLSEQLKNYLNDIDPRIVTLMSQATVIPVLLNQLHANDLATVSQKLLAERVLEITPSGKSMITGSGVIIEYNFRALENF